MKTILKDRQYIRFCFYGFLKNLRFFDAFLLLFFIEKGLSYTEIGLLYAAREICINLLEIPSGIFADTYGRKSSLLGSFGLYLLSFVLFFFSDQFWWLLAAMIIYGMGDAFRSGTHKGMIMDYLKHSGQADLKVSYYGHTRSWSQRGSAIASLIAGILVFYSGSYQQVFLYAIIPYLINFVNIATYPSRLNHSSKAQKKKETSFIATLKAVWMVIKNRRLLKIMHSEAVHTAYVRAVKDYIQAVMAALILILPFFSELTEKQKSGLLIGLIYFIIYLLNAWASKNAGKVAKIKSFHVPTATLFLGFGAGLLSGLFYHWEFWWISLLAFVLMYLNENLRKPILVGAVADEVDARILTSVISAQAFYRTILTAVIAFGFGVVADKAGVGIALISVSAVLLGSIGFLRTEK